VAALNRPLSTVAVLHVKGWAMGGVASEPQCIVKYEVPQLNSCAPAVQ
jgi:hypothetical protein